jgi:crossover junction endodeoxyribonuclease RuvC
MAEIKLLGLDPGLRITGWGVLAVNGNRLRHIADGAVVVAPSGNLADRLARLYRGLEAVVATHMPDEAAVEETFVNRNPASTLKLGQARGVVLLVPALASLPVFEYSANLIKKSLVGTGHATKDQVAMMIRTLLPGAQLKKPDAADALAVAVCHAHHRTDPARRLDPMASPQPVKVATKVTG